MRRRVRKLIGWGLVLLVAVIIGGGWFAYSYVTDNETLRNAIRDGAPRFLPGCLVDVHRVRVHPFAGQIEVTSLSIRKVEAGNPNPLLVGTSPWVQISCDPWAMLDGRFELKEVVVAQPRLRLRRRKDGSWNFQGLLANPWPMPPSETTPPIRIENGTVELVDESDGPDVAPAAILRDVSVKISASDMQGTPIKFEGKARGDLYESFKLEGAIDRKTGRVMLSGDLTRLALSKTLGDRLPAEARPAFRKLGLIGGELDATIRSLAYDPKAAVPIRYDAKVQIRSGVWACEKLPFPVNELSAVLVLRDGKLIVEHAEGRNGPTTARATGEIVLGDLMKTPFHLELEAEGVEIDNRLRDWMFITFDKVGPTLWRDFDPSGRVNLSADLDRTAPGRPIDWKVAVNCLDVATTYREFRYPLEHVMGEVVASPIRVDIDLHTLVGGKPLTAKGFVDQPATSKIVDLDFTALSLPIDKALLDAMPPDVRNSVMQFKPAGTVRGKAHVHRTPPVLPSDPAKGVITFTADLDLNPGCEITWDGLKYPVRDLTGHLAIRPSSWIFREVRGTHGQAVITGEGRVDSLASGDRKVGLHVHADNILFESQLRDALRPAWQKAWDRLNPTGASDVDVKISTDPGKTDHYHLEIIPRPQTNLRLKFERMAVEGDGGGMPMIEMPMEDVRGLFVFNDGVVTMRDGKFSFRNAPVKFDWGEVQVHDSGAFSLKVRDLCVEDFRVDHGLRQLMPPVMAKFARRLDDGKTFRIRTDLALGWSGKLNELATCAWENGLVVFLDNSIEAGLTLKHLQGQLDHLHGSFNGRDLEVGGALALDSISLFDNQVTNLASPIEVKDGRARLTQIRGTLMKGQITGRVEVALDATPKFETSLTIEGANLESYARSMAGKQEIRGLLSGDIQLSGLGGDPRSYQGRGKAKITQGDLGKLPAWGVFLKALNLGGRGKTAFDRAEVVFTVRNGQTALDPIEFFGDAFSLHGRGTMDVQGELNVPLRVLYSRDTWHIPGFSDMMREIEGQILVIRVNGTVTAPDYKLEPFPVASEFARSLGERRATRMPRERNMPRLPFGRPRRADDAGP